MPERIMTSYIYFYMKLYESDKDKLENAVAAVVAEMGVSKYEAYKEIFWWGIEAAMERVKDASNRMALREAVTRVKLLKGVREATAEDSELRDAVRALGTDRVRQIAKEQGLDLDTVNAMLENASKTPVGGLKGDTWNESMNVWLDMFLAGKGNMNVDVVKMEAIKDGMLPPMTTAGEENPLFNAQWKAMRNYASRVGYASAAPYGHWCKRDH